MSSSIADNRRIAKNTLLLYVRMIVLMGINLYTSRVVLNALGEEDYGIYSVVGSVVTMFTAISGSLSAAISRYITFNLGKGKKEILKKIFSISMIIQLLLALIIIVIGEILGIWFINDKMSIPDNRIFSANWVLQFSILTFVFNLINIPYNACIVAHERMQAFAYIGLFEGVATLAIAFLINFSPIDKLIWYALLMCVVSLIVRLIYQLYCRRHFDECVFRWSFDMKIFKDIFSFAGWNFIGVTSGVLRDQGINMLLNVYYGPVVNAARGIAMQVNTAVTKFSSNFITAVRPQITKQFAVDDRENYINLVNRSTKFSSYLLSFLCLPIILETDYFISLWLVEVPDYTIIFTRLILFLSIIDNLSSSLIILLLAVGKLKIYQLIVGGIQLLNFPIAYLLLYLGFQPQSTIVSVICISIICLFARLYLLKLYVNYPVSRFLLLILRTLAVITISYYIPKILMQFFSEGLLRVVIVTIFTELVLLSMILLIGVTKGERNFIYNQISIFIKKIGL